MKKTNPVVKFGALLRQMREGAGWTQEDLAGELNADRAWVSQLERGLKNPSLITMIKLADVFSVKVTFADSELN
ncbi:MAG: helix-turn-helix domain-containing protein [Candidatus Obscuribacterales bacterium]|nr:helix-turn-helix domain-containing protein [Candidatus Obscuribacterales bacterium]